MKHTMDVSKLYLKFSMIDSAVIDKMSLEENVFPVLIGYRGVGESAIPQHILNDFLPISKGGFRQEVIAVIMEKCAFSTQYIHFTDIKKNSRGRPKKDQDSLW